MLTACRKAHQGEIKGGLSVAALHLHESTGEPDRAAKMKHVPVPFKSLSSNPRCSDRPLSQWDCLSPRHIPSGMRMRQDSVGNKDTLAQNSATELSGFQRFIRRMESASPKIVLDRLKEDWPTDGEIDEEVSFGWRFASEIPLIGVSAGPGEAALAPYRIADASCWQSSTRSETTVPYGQDPGALWQPLYVQSVF